MLQATILDCAYFDIFPFFKNALTSAEVDICWSEIAQAPAPSSIVVIVKEGSNLILQVAI
jgi:hypothetical protein